MSDGFKLGRDPEAKDYEMGADSAAPGTSDETIIQVDGGCTRCKKNWPDVKFTKIAGEYFYGVSKVDPKEIVCDSCQDKEATAELAAQIDEAQGIATALGPTRYVEVEGIESKSNVIKFRYATHVGGKELIVTTLTIWFKGKQGAEPVRYRYFEIPTLVLEAWFISPKHGQSFGQFFAEQIKTSYRCQKEA